MRKAGIVLVLVAASLLGVPSIAAAGLPIGPISTPATVATCGDPLIENPFLFDGDPLDYVLAPNGSFEDAYGGWLLEGGATQVPGNDPFPIRPDGDESILSLPPGGSATSPLMCVDLAYPTFRFALRQLAPQDGRLKVESMYPDSSRPKWRKVTAIRSSDEGWSLSDHLELNPEQGGVLPGARQVSLRFTFRGAHEGEPGAFEIDDLYVDPKARN